MRIQLRGGTAAEWTTANPVLASREPGVESDTGREKIGDGVAAWNDLGYTGTSTSEINAAVDALLAGAPGALDTLNELAAALGDDANFAATVTTALAGKQASSAKGQANGYAGLDGSSVVPDAQLPAALARDTEVTAAVNAEAVTRAAADTAEATARATADALLIPLAQKGAASGVATLDGSSLIPDAQIPGTITRDSELSAAIAALVNSAPGTLDTLAEIATALGSDPNLATTLTNLIALKVAKAGDTMTGELVVPDVKVSGKNSLSPRTFVGRKTTTGAPTTGTWAVDEEVIDSAGITWRCTVAGTPGTWVQVTATSVLVNIAKITLSGTAASIDFTGLDLSPYSKVVLDGILRSAVAAQDDDAHLYFNNDTTETNYAKQTVIGSGTGNATAVSALGAVNSTLVLSMPGSSTSPANSFADIEIVIPKPSSTAALKAAQIRYARYRSTSSLTENFASMYWLPAPAAITRITIVPVTGPLAIGSEVTLRGFLAAA